MTGRYLAGGRGGAAPRPLRASPRSIFANMMCACALLARAEGAR